MEMESTTSLLEYQGAASPSINKTGAVFTIFMGRARDQITTNDFFSIDNSHPGLNLSRSDRFGNSIANIGDRNGDGINDLAVGAPLDDSGGNNSGAFYMLYMDAETVIRGITATAENGSYITDDTIHIQVIFSEAVDVSGEPTLSLETGSTDTQALYTMGSGSDTLIFRYTVVSNDLATDLGYKSTVSLDLNGGTINAASTPNSAAFLGLPEPGTRGSLSSNKNISINTTAITNTAPTQDQSIPAQELTVNIPFIVTIPAGTFTDADNDPLTYSLSELPGLELPNWLTLDTYTGIFSGTPLEEQGLTIYTFLVSDGTASTDSTISITVNAAPTLPTIGDINYSPGSLISETLPTVIEGTGTKPIKYTLSPADGLMFSTETRMITGIAPIAEQTRQYTYTAEDKNGALTAQIFTLIIKTLEPPNILDKTYSLGNTINEILPAATGGTGALTYTLTPELADGLTFSTATRAISGTPERLSRSEYTYTAEDSASPVNTVSTNFFITIIADAISSFPAKGNGRISGIIKYDRVTFPGIPIGAEFGSSVADMGDIDGNGIDDLAVGAPFDDSGANNAGAVYILLMNADNTVKPNPARITHSDDPASIQLPTQARFGTSVVNIGDFDGNGINELAIGTRERGIIYIVHLTRSGELDRFSTLDFNDINTILGNTDLIIDDRFGFSIANLGDIDDDGIIDLAVGAPRGDGGLKGSVYILFMDKTETGDPTLKDVVKLDVTDADLDNGDTFGVSVANLGDLNQDGINDLAVGAPNDDDGQAINAGTVHIFYLNRDGSVKPGGFKIFDDAFNQRSGYFAGASIANLGDINGDGINDIAVGVLGADSPGTNDNTGAVSTIFMGRARNQITTNDFLRIDNNSYPDLNLSERDRFGESIANIGDRNGDGINDLAVGASLDDSGGTDSGALYILYMDVETVIRGITAAAENGSYNTDDTIHIQVIFSEAVDVSGEPTLTLETGSTDTQALYTMGSGSDTLIFRYTVASTDLATDLDYVATTALTLNGGTINATAAPNYRALLTLPEPGTRGSLSSNKNISINTDAITNTAPTRELTIPTQELTANTTFAYTIPTGAFTDAENDPLTYSASGLPRWLTLDTYTGIFSGTPVTEQGLTTYTYTVSDDTTSTDSTIGIIVNKALTLSPIADINYSPGSGDKTFTIQLPIAGGGTGDITYTLSPVLVNELTFDAATGKIMLTPTAEEKTRTYTYTAEDQNGALAAQVFTLTIKALGFSNISDKTYLFGSTINETLPLATGGTGAITAITYRLSPALPNPLTFSTATRVISGIVPALEQKSESEYTYTVQDEIGTETSQTFTIIIKSPPVPIGLNVQPSLLNIVIGMSSQLTVGVSVSEDTDVTLTVTVDSRGENIIAGLENEYLLSDETSTKITVQGVGIGDTTLTITVAAEDYITETTSVSVVVLDILRIKAESDQAEFNGRW